MRQVSDDERRTRLAHRHGFVDRPRDVMDLAAGLAGIHSTDPVSVFIAAAARRVIDTVEEMESALYEKRTCLRMLGMRRTLFVVPVDHAAAVQRGYTDAFVAREKRRLAGWLEATDVASDGMAHIDRMTQLVLALVEEAGEASTRELTSAHIDLNARFTPPVGGQTGTLSVGSRIVLLMTASGMLARTRPLGTWISSQYRYAPMERWIGGPIPEVGDREARMRLTEAWLASYGPGTLTDLQWWAGWNLGQTRRALEDVGAVEVELTTGTGYVLADDVGPVESVEPWAALLGPLDSTPMGWKQRDWYLGEYASRLFDRNGNVGPTVWFNGRVVGGWAQRPDGELMVEFLEDVSADCRSLVEVEAARLTEFFGSTRFTPRFRTPLERTITAS